MAHDIPSRRLPVGAEIQPGGNAHFRVWAPRRRSIHVVTEGASKETPLHSENNGYFSGMLSAPSGTLYRYRLDGDKALPDPASRFQPQGPHGPSQIVDPASFRWTDPGWRGIDCRHAIIYEMHIGTFTKAGTWAAAIEQLPALAELGVTLLEVMPVAEFPGKFGWGYDGVDLFAPTHLYGGPDDFRRFVDRAHALGLGVLLDVVYNHFGPDGNYVGEYAAAYFTDRYKNEWGQALNFDGDDAGPVREFFSANAGYWIDEYHLDGLRLDATQQIFDCSVKHILTEIGAKVRQAARGRATVIVCENETQETRLVKPCEKGGHELDLLWNDDFHHAAVAALTGHKEAYYSDYGGTPQEFVSAAKWGYLYQGQRYRWQKHRRGTPALDLAPGHFVNFLENHDQVANSALGLRLHQCAAPGAMRALTALTILMPGVPMLFQGQEFGSSKPFLFFADHHRELAALVRSGRAKFLCQFPSMALPAIQEQLAHPGDPATFERCKLDHGERATHSETLALHRDLIKLRREAPAFQVSKRGDCDGAVLGAEAFLLRYFHADGDRLLLVNVGRDLQLDSAPEPLLAPPADTMWELLWSSEDPRYGGAGALHPEAEDIWRLPGHAAVVLWPRRKSDDSKREDERTAGPAHAVASSK